MAQGYSEGERDVRSASWMLPEEVRSGRVLRAKFLRVGPVRYWPGQDYAAALTATQQRSIDIRRRCARRDIDTMP